MSEFKDRIRDILLPGEAILWGGKPVQGVVWTINDLWKVPLFVLLVAITTVSIYATHLAFTGVNEFANNIYMLLYVMRDAALVFAVVSALAMKLYISPRRRFNTDYIITSRRVIISTHNSAHYLDLKAIYDFNLSYNGPGIGRISFGLDRFDADTHNVRFAPYFDCVANVHDVYLLLINAQRSTITRTKAVTHPHAKITLRDTIKRSLAVGEKLVWSSPPVDKIFIRWIDIPFIVFGSFFLIFPIFIIISDETAFTKFVAFIFVIPHFFGGAYIAFGRFVIDAQRRSKKIHYAITQDRIVIASRSTFFTKLTSLNLLALNEPFLRKFRGSIGTIKFGSDYPMSRHGHIKRESEAPAKLTMLRVYKAPEFRLIHDVATVFQLILTTRNSALARNEARKV